MDPDGPVRGDDVTLDQMFHVQLFLGGESL